MKGNKIACDGQIALSKANANVQIIGVQNADGSYPELNFSDFMAKYIGKASSDAAVGVRIYGSNYTLQNLIIEHAPDNGIQIKGKTVGNNKVPNCIVRYNNDTGLQVTAGAYRNTIEAVYSYRNCDVYTRSGNADGFAPKLGAGSGNTFTYCYAWDNSDGGWDSFDKVGDVTPDITCTNCAVWNNGKPDVFTGKYDFDHKKALDEIFIWFNSSKLMMAHLLQIMQKVNLLCHLETSSRLMLVRLDFQLGLAIHLTVIQIALNLVLSIQNQV